MAPKRKDASTSRQSGELNIAIRPRVSNRLRFFSVLDNYFDHGDYQLVCEYCGAMFWDWEKSSGVRVFEREKYYICCRGGTVCLPFPFAPPEVLKQFFTDPSFRRNIRVYNSMFAMTSFGVTVDDSVNDRPGPYVFKYLVDAYVCIEASRLKFLRDNQDRFRCEFLSGVYDAMTRGDVDGRSIGKRVVLPSSFTGGPQYMYQHYQDALSICRVFGNPQYFITFTCNSCWPEILRYVHKYPPLQPNDRADFVCRVFQIKVQYLIKFLQESRIFGDVTAYLYTIEFHKRGLPHCHFLQWVADRFKIKDACDVDKYICAEIPDAVEDPELYKIVTDSMTHGPCGLMNPNAPCMKKGKCSKDFSRSFQPYTAFDRNGYILYMRRNNGRYVAKNGYPLDNGYVVPYC